MNETILLELQLKVAECQRDLAIAEKNLMIASSSKTNTQAQNIGILSCAILALQDGALSTKELAALCSVSNTCMRVTMNRAKAKGIVARLKSSHVGLWELTKKGNTFA